MKPITMEENGVTNPAAGVMATSPAIAPDTAPSMVGLFSIHSIKIQPIIPAAAAVFVLMKANIAILSSVRALPTLKPNHPNQMSAPPKNV